MSTGNVVDLSKKFAVDPATRSFLAAISVGREISDALQLVMPGLTHNEQRVMTVLVSFRMMGGMLPCSLELLRRMPPFDGVHFENIRIACEALVENGVLSIVTGGDDEMAFTWEALESLLTTAVTAANTSGLVDKDGNRIF